MFSDPISLYGAAGAVRILAAFVFDTVQHLAFLPINRSGTQHSLDTVFDGFRHQEEVYVLASPAARSDYPAQYSKGRFGSIFDTIPDVKVG